MKNDLRNSRDMEPLIISSDSERKNRADKSQHYHRRGKSSTKISARHPRGWRLHPRTTTSSHSEISAERREAIHHRWLRLFKLSARRSPTQTAATRPKPSRWRRMSDRPDRRLPLGVRSRAKRVSSCSCSSAVASGRGLELVPARPSPTRSH